ncbi:uncharacterized protein C6orf222 homolog [Octodon degus]|uniref:Uncharacterized protein C6orf222 homolog n=1 Tax=Octodon degus TaxID=10160 RepID=A0A6P6EVX6_OCTDE|nr:uncharacterized protein C6orf222 homolog [Octodon degus]
MSDFRGSSQMEDPRRTQSLDRSRASRKDSESHSCQCLSLPSTSCRRVSRRAIDAGAQGSLNPGPSSGAQGAEAAAADTLEEARGFLPSEPGPPPDTKKDKAQRQVQQGWLKTVLNFILGIGFEESKDKAPRRPKEKEDVLESPEIAEELTRRKKAQDKKASYKKHSHRKHGAEEVEGSHDQEEGSRQARLPKMAATSYSEEAEVAPVCKGGQDSSGHQALPSRGAGAELRDSSPQATGSRPTEEPRKPAEDDVIRMIVEFLEKVGDQCEEEPPAPQTEALVRNPTYGCRRKPQEKKASSLKRALSLKKCSPEQPRRVGAASNVPSLEARPPKRPSFLPLCVGGGQRPSTSSSPGCEGAGAHEAWTTDGGGPSPSELPTRAGCRGPKEELPLDRASESNEFLRKILMLLGEEEEPAGEQQPQGQEAEAAGESQAQAMRRKPQEKKPSSLRRAFSYKRHSSKEPRRTGAVETGGAVTPDPRPPKRPSFLPLCVSVHRASIPSSSDEEDLESQEPLATEGAASGFPKAASQASSCTPDGGLQLPQEGACTSKEHTIYKLVQLLQEVDGELGKQIRRHPSFKRLFYEFSDSSLRKLVAILRSQRVHPADGDRNLPKRSFPLAFGLANKYADSHSRTFCSLMGSRGHYSQHGGAQALAREAQPNLTSPGCQSPD